MSERIRRADERLSDAMESLEELDASVDLVPAASAPSYLLLQLAMRHLDDAMKAFASFRAREERSLES